MDSDKLLPAGRVYQIEMSSVFFTAELSEEGSSSKQTTRKEGHRAVLREVGNVPARFGERGYRDRFLRYVETVADLSSTITAAFTRTMLHDHLPSLYEATTRVLAEGLNV
jgi:hypothetical protein